MAAQSIASRSRPPHRPDTDDVVLSRALEFSNWARNNVRVIVIGAVLAAVVVGGLLYYRMYRADRMERAATEYMQLEQTAAAGNPALAQRELESFATRYEGTPYADEARIALAQLHLQAGRAEEAIAAAQPVAADIGGSPVGSQAALLLGAAQAASGDPEAAIRTYLRVADQANLPFRRIEALSAAALLRSEAGDFAGAAELYARAVRLSDEGSLERSMYEMRMAEAQARAEAS